MKPMEEQVAVLATSNRRQCFETSYLVGRSQSVNESGRSAAYQPCLKVSEAQDMHTDLNSLSIIVLYHHHSAEATQGIPLL